MIIWILPAIIVFVIIIVLAMDGDLGFGLMIAPLAYLGFVLIGLLSFGLIGNGIAELTNAEYEIVAISEEPLIAFQDDHQIKGKFFLGCGTVEETEYYYYISRKEDKGYQVQKESTSNCYLDFIEEDGKYQTPHRVVYEKQWTNPVVRFFVPIFTGWTTYYVPEGSIINDYNVDLQ